jgi:O-antigen/teichoic acid export membrane protein
VAKLPLAHASRRPKPAVLSWARLLASLAHEKTMHALKEKTIRGGAARLVGQALSLLLRLGTLIGLARIIDPSEFGLVAMVTAITGVFDIFAAGGLSTATIQKADVSHAQLSTLFWINMAIGTLLAALCVASGPLVAAFYHEQRTAWIIAAVAPAFVFNAASVQHLALMQRQLRYVAITAIELASQIVASSLAIGLALADCGYWALVANVIVVPLVTATCAWGASGWLPGRPRLNSEIGSMLRFGWTVTLNGVVVYVGYNFEKVLLGRYWGSDVLGLYGRAFQLVNLPTATLNGAIGPVAFAALSRLQNDPVCFKSYFIRGYSLVLSMTVPTTIFCALFSDDVIIILLGPKWSDAAIVFRLLVPTILIFGIINPLGWLLLSIGLQGRSLKLGLVIAPLVSGAYLVGLPFGPNGVAFAYSGAMTLWLVPHVMWCLHGTVISMHDLLLAAGRPLLSGVVAGLVAATFATHIAHPVARIVLGGAIMLVLYAWFLLVVMKQRSFYLGLLKGLRGASR